MAGQLQFQKWLPNLIVTRDGKHIYNFRQAFPLDMFGLFVMPSLVSPPARALRRAQQASDSETRRSL
jgi:hypothetical protein